MQMLKGQLGIVAAVAALAVTAGAFFLVNRDGRGKAEDAARQRTESAFHAVHTVLAAGGDTAKAVAQQYTGQVSRFFAAAGKYQVDTATELAKASSGMEEGWSPDVIGVVNSRRVVVWSRIMPEAIKPGVTPSHLTHRLLDADYADPVLRGRAPSAVGKFPWPDVLAAPAKAVVVPLLGANRAAVGALVLVWKGREDERELKEKAELFRDKVDVVRMLLPRSKMEDDLAAMLSDELPDDIHKAHGVRPAFVGLLDQQGVLIQRNDRLRLFVGQAFAPDSLALQTTRAQRIATTEAWLKSAILDVRTAVDRGGAVRPEIVRVGFAPVVGKDGAAQGVLVVAWELGDVHASQMASLSGAQVAYLHGSSLSTSTLRNVDSARLAAVPRSGFDPGEWKAPRLHVVQGRSERYIAAAAPIPGAGRGEFAFVVLSSVDKRHASFGFALMIIVGLGALMVLGFLVVGWLLRRYFILPIAELERGVADIVAGNMEHTFGVPSRETEGLAYSLNVLMAQLLGRPEPGDEEEEEGGESVGAARMGFALGPLPDRPYRPGDSQLIPRLDENREAYFRRIFTEYVELMQTLGEDTSGFELQTLRGKLELNERMICARLNCSEVRFSVVKGEEGVVLQPYPVA